MAGAVLVLQGEHITVREPAAVRATQTQNGAQIIVVQIAGLIARRILSFIKTGKYLSAGERFGLIRFGSRVDIYMPKNTKIDIGLGDKVVAGETIIAHLK